MTAKATSKLNTQIYEEACEWFVNFRAGDIDATARQQFDTWARTSPEHLRAYLEIAAIWNEGASLDQQRKLDVETLTARARAEDNVVPLGTIPTSSDATVPEKGQPLSPRAVPSRRRFMLAASVLIACVGAGLFAWHHMYRPTYATEVGEQRSIALTDGSTVELNSRSRLQVRFTEAERTVELLEGQALFQVAKDAERPFVVHSDATRVQAVGTQFDVYRKKNGTTVTVLEGRVAVVPEGTKESIARLGKETEEPAKRKQQSASSRAGGPNAPIFLSAGEQVTVTAEAVPQPTRANIAAATAWTQRRLVFESASIAEVAEEFNRYNTRQLVIQGPAPDDFHISGVFSSTDPASLVRFLRERPGLSVHETEKEIQISRK